MQHGYSNISCKTSGECIINEQTSTNKIRGGMLKARDADRGILGREKLGSKSLKPQLGLAPSNVDRKRRIQVSNGHLLE